MGMDRKNYIKLIAFLSVIVFFINSCINYPKDKQSKICSNYGIKFNDYRLKLGLPILDSTWIFSKTFSKNENICKWINTTNIKTEPYHFSKTVGYVDDTILWETNHYVGINKIKTIDGEFPEELFITYNFNKDSMFKWEYRFSKQFSTDIENLYRIEVMSISKKEVDSIIKIWDI
jgi:hypothetical protein